MGNLVGRGLRNGSSARVFLLTHVVSVSMIWTEIPQTVTGNLNIEPDHGPLVAPRRNGRKGFFGLRQPGRAICPTVIFGRVAAFPQRKKGANRGKESQLL